MRSATPWWRPTGEVWWRADAALARGYRHWAFLAQPAPLPERLIAGDPQGFFDLHVREGMGLGCEAGRYAPETLDAYRRLLDDPEIVEAMCEDDRAGATVDVDHDDADRKAGRQIACPVLVLWAAGGGLPRFYGDPLDVWRPWAPDLRGRPVDASHSMVEDRPGGDVAAELTAFPTELWTATTHRPSTSSVAMRSQSTPELSGANEATMAAKLDGR